jgi:hypothetical protein
MITINESSMPAHIANKTNVKTHGIKHMINKI